MLEGMVEVCMVGDRAGKVVVLLVTGEFEQLPVEKSEIFIAPTDQLFDLSQREYPATKEVRRDSLLTAGPAVPACAPAAAVAEEVKRGRFTYL